MLNRLRWKLTFSYIIATLALILLVGGGSYYVLQNYLKSEVDLTLAHGMAGQFMLFGFDLPNRLEEAEEEWINKQARLTSNAASANPSLAEELASSENNDNERDEDEHNEQENEASELQEHGYGSQLISIFTMPLSSTGNLIFNPNPYPLPMPPDQDAFDSAVENGFDVRTVHLPDGKRVRLLTYLTGVQEVPAAFQLGRILVDQDLVLRQLLIGILTISSISLVVVGFGSWQLAGGSIKPAQIAMDQQQAFVANASHELRTPLTLIRASTEMALRKNPDVSIHGLLQDVISEADYMNRLVDDLLLLSRLDAQQIQLEFTQVDLGTLVTETAGLAKRMAAEKEITIQADILNKNISADITRLRQVLLILLNNAINYTPDGGKIHLSCLEQKRHILIRVQDNGEGIAPEHLPFIFDRFYQAKANFNKEQRSNGLGLSIAKNLISLHQGQITAESELGKGTTITVQLPIL